MNDSDNFKTNNLISEKSPYLLQHAYNPVEWNPWGKEAFELAREQNKSIFLSIGYSTCHWCHVMEHESFEDREVAELMNDTFVCIKVDREERPDIDNIYMSVCQMLIGSGGWPLTIVMTPEQKPFFAGTYFPKHTRGNRIGMMELIPKLKAAWENQKEEVFKSADEITNHLATQLTIDTSETISENIFENVRSNFKNRFDSTYGGFGERPKFPSPHNLSFLIRDSQIYDDNESLEMVTKTLTEMRKGGIFDQLGFGFHRYSTDKRWFLPHFEKMLYDQAMLAIAYTEAYQLTGNDLFKRTVEEILAYVSRDMTSQEGGFYSAEDADSEGEEGKFYLWDKNEILTLLGEENGELFSNTFNIVEKGNYFEEATGHQTGTNHLFLEDESMYLLNNDEIFRRKIDTFRNKLFLTREKRVHPYKDDKILTDWNGLMIVAFAKASRTIGKNTFLKIAQKSVDFIFDNLIDNNGNLLHRFRDGDAAINGQIDDYAFLIWGLLELYETNFDTEYLKKSIRLTNHVIDNFWDSDNNSGFYFTSSEDSELISRPKEFYDGAIPSGNSVMYLNLLKINKLTAAPKFLKYSEYLKLAFKNFVDKTPTGFSQFLIGLQFSFDTSYEIIIVGNRESEKTKEIIKSINNKFIPNKVVLLVDEHNKKDIGKIAPYTKNYPIIKDETTVYVCKNYVCSLPTTDKTKVMELLSSD